MVCPLCGGSVKHVPGESIHVTFDRHARQSCDPSRHPARVPRCPVPGCKEKLSSVNAYQCKTCRAKVCLKHRFADKHFCGDRTKLRGGGVAATGGAASTAGVAASRRAAFHGPGTSRVGAPAAIDARDTNRRGPSTVALAREVCDQCGASFPHLAALIAHAEAAHQGGRSGRGAPPPGRTSTGREVCPRCGLSFPDVGALVTHVEREHEGGARRSRGSSSQCRIS